MVDSSTRENGSTDDVSDDSVSRRRFLRTAGATAAVGAGAVGATNSAAAISKTEGSQDGPADFPRFSTRDNYSVTWYGSTQEEAEWWEYEKWGDFNGYGIYDGDELVIHIHGWTNDDESAVDGAYTSDVALSQDGNYDQPVAGWSWDADKGTWWNATTIAEGNGPTLAYATYIFKQNNPGTPVRWISHSLGGRVAAEGLKQLDEWGYTDYVESATFLGAAVDNEDVAYGGEYYSGIANAAKKVDNFHKTDDSVLGWAYSTAELGAAVGQYGADGTPPANYTDHDVTNQVADHYSHYYPSVGVMDQVVANF